MLLLIRYNRLLWPVACFRKLYAQFRFLKPSSKVYLYRAANGQNVLRLKIRDLWTFDKHARASSAIYECSTHIAQPITNVAIVISGNRMVVTLEFIGGLTRHLLMDWCTLQAMVKI